MKWTSVVKTCLLICCCSSTAITQSNSLFEEIKAHKEGVGLWWVGHNGWIIKSGDLVVCTDILLDYDKRLEPPLISAEELASILDISFVTHGHRDHFNRSASKIFADKGDCLFVLPESCRNIAEELEIPEHRIRYARPREPFEVLGVKVEALRAIHGNANFAIYYDANLQDCGYVINIGGKRFLQPGDTHLLEDHLFLQNINVLFFSPTEHNMYIDPSVILINKLQPDYIFPQHHSTVIVNEQTRFWAKGYPEEVKLRLAPDLMSKYFIMKAGQKKLIE